MPDYEEFDDDSRMYALAASPPRGVVSFLEKSEATRLFSLIYSKIPSGGLLSTHFDCVLSVFDWPVNSLCCCVASPFLLRKKKDNYQLEKILGFGAGLRGLS